MGPSRIGSSLHHIGSGPHLARARAESVVGLALGGVGEDGVRLAHLRVVCRCKAYINKQTTTTTKGGFVQIEQRRYVLLFSNHALENRLVVLSKLGSSLHRVLSKLGSLIAPPFLYLNELLLRTLVLAVAAQVLRQKTRFQVESKFIFKRGLKIKF